LVEQSNAASHSLAKEANNLFAVVGQVNIGGAPSAQVASAPRRTAPTPVKATNRPEPSPARQMNVKLASALHGSAAVAGSEWEEF